MKVMLPKTLGKLADLCPKDTGRYPAFAGIRLTTGEGSYQAEITDGRYLVRVKDTCETTGPVIPALEAAPNGATASVIPSKAWKEAFRSVPKDEKLLGVVQSPEVTTMAHTQGCFTPTNVEGRWPHTDELFTKKPPKATTVIPAKQLAALITFAATLNTDGSDRVVIEVFDESAPIQIKAGPCVALLMPLRK